MTRQTIPTSHQLTNAIVFHRDRDVTVTARFTIYNKAEIPRFAARGIAQVRQTHRDACPPEISRFLVPEPKETSHARCSARHTVPKCSHYDVRGSCTFRVNKKRLVFLFYFLNNLYRNLEWSNKLILEFLQLYEQEPCTRNHKSSRHKVQSAVHDSWDSISP
jgi:hypothetical protein